MRVGDRVRLKEAYRPEGCTAEQWASRAVGLVTSVSGAEDRKLIDIDFADRGQSASKVCALWYEVEPALAVTSDDIGL